MIHLPLFPLDTVLFPNTPLPLHIFEERYRLLVSKCIENGEPFGVVYHRGRKLEQIGCSATIERVLKRYDDGRMDIVTVGKQRFSIESVDTSEPYLQGLVRFLDENEAEPADVEPDLTTTAIDALLRYAYYAEVEIDRAKLRDLTLPELSYLIAGIDEMGMETKQRLLEMDSSARRLEHCIHALDTINEQLVVLMSLRKATGQDIDLRSMKN